MQETSALYKQIIETPNHYFKPWLSIYTSSTAAYSVTTDKLFSLTTSNSCFANEEPQVGCAIAGEIEAKLIVPPITIPSMAKLKVSIEAVMEESGQQTYSEQIPKGTYYIDTRSVSNNSDGLDVLTIHGYDSMLKFEQMYPSDSSHDYPILDIDMVQFMASSVGVSVDQRTIDIMDSGYTFPLPAGYTMREMLGYVAGAYGGNFVMSEEDKLLLIQLKGKQTETFYLVDESGNAITFGGNRILVD